MEEKPDAEIEVRLKVDLTGKCPTVPRKKAEMGSQTWPALEIGRGEVDDSCMRWSR